MWRDIIRDLDSLGSFTLLLSFIIGIFAGFGYTYNMGIEFRKLNAIALLPKAIGVAAVRELAPLCSLLICGARLTAQITAELAGWKTGSKLDALMVSKISPVKKLIIPKIIATLIIIPFLTFISFCSIVITGFFITKIFFGVVSAEFWRDIFLSISPNLYIALAKSLLMGLALPLIPCWYGIHSLGGTYSGKSVAIAVTFNIVFILILDILIDWAML